MRLVNWFIADRLDMLVRPNFRKHQLLKWGIFFILLAILGFLYVASAHAQATVALSPVAKQQFFSATGIPLASGCVNTYITGTATPLATYVDGTGATQNANPIILDGGGFANIWLQNASYRFVVVAYDGIPGNKCAAGITQYTVDNINAYAPISTGANLFLLGQNSDPAGTAGEMVYRTDIPCFRFFTTLWDCAVTLTATQTLTNKTLTTPTVNSPVITTPVINGQTTGTGIQGTDSKLLSAGNISGAGNFLCVDGVGGATTLGCVAPVDGDQTGLTTNVPATALGGAITANGFYRFSCFVIDTQAATTSSTLPACSFTFTLADTSQVASLPICASVTTNVLGDTCQIVGINFMNYAYVKNGSFIKYQTTGYASVGGTPLTYAVHARLEGPF